jgi:glycosyltransferase involved in cell wall biosynthesis
MMRTRSGVQIELQNETPQVSIIVATRNRPKLLARALNSILAQTLQEFEVLIVDDGSDPEDVDQYEQIIRSLDGRFSFLRPSAPGTPGTGPATARNRGVSKARGEYVAFLDDDDTWILSDHLEVAVRSMQQGGADYYFTSLHCELNGPKSVHWEPNSELLMKGKQVFNNPPVYEVAPLVFADMCRHAGVHLNVTVGRRNDFAAIGGFVDGMWYNEDTNMMLRLADNASRILFRPDRAATYQLPQGNSVVSSLSSSNKKTQGLFSAKHARLSCNNKRFKRSARSREAWVLRDLSLDALEKGWPGEAVRLALESAVVFFTLGSCLFVGRQILAGARCLLGSRKNQSHAQLTILANTFQQSGKQPT